jgi:PPOX class probable F420-dependent enzyme
VNWEDFLNERPIGVVATVGADGMPHAVPVEVVARDGVVYSWCRSDSVKARNVARTPRAALTAYKGHAFVSVRGRARLIPQGEPGYDDVARAFLDKYEREETYGNDTLIAISADKVASARI